MKKTPNVTVKLDEKNPEPVEVIAQAIINVSDAFDKIRQSKLNERAILVLIKDHCGVSLNHIKLVLDTAASLKDIYLKKEAKK